MTPYDIEKFLNIPHELIADMHKDIPDHVHFMRRNFYSRIGRLKLSLELPYLQAGFNNE